jgi:hypothetical protein
MTMRKRLQHIAFIAMVFLLSASPGLAEERHFAGLLMDVNLESREVHLSGNVLLHVSSKSRLFDRGGEKVDLEAFAQSAKQPPSKDSNGITLTYYKAEAAEPGKLVIDWISLAGPIEE